LGTSFTRWHNGVEDELAVEPRGWLVELAGYASDTDSEITPEVAIRRDATLGPSRKAAGRQRAAAPGCRPRPT
jgi:hypothetical protein